MQIRKRHSIFVAHLITIKTKTMKITTTSKTFLSLMGKHTSFYIDGVLTKTVVTNVETQKELYTYYPVPAHP